MFWKKEPQPWLTFDSIKWLKNHLIKKMKVFEWGSGNSTLFYEKKCKIVVSVEHDKTWYEKVKSSLKKSTDYLLIPPEIGHGFKSSDNSLRKYSFNNYCNKILDYPDNYFDLIAIDGRARNSCIKLSMKKVKPMGYILVDNSERKEYSKGLRLLNNWKRTDFFGPGPINDYPWQTSIFQRISV